MNETADMHGHLTLQLIAKDGAVVKQISCKNMIVKDGRKLVAQLFAGIPGGTPPSKVTHMGVGTDKTPAKDDQTALLGERSPRKEISEVTFTEFTDTATGAARVKATLKTVFDFKEANDPGVPLQEAGIFTALTLGVMYNRVVFEPVVKTEAFKLTMNWEVTF